MIYLIIALALALALALYLYGVSRYNNYRLIQDYEVELVKGWVSYKALEQGRDEETEAYEQMFLSYQERIQTLENTLQVSDMVAHEQQLEIDFHQRHSLPWLQRMDLLQWDIESLDEPTPIFDELSWGWVLHG